MNPDYHTTIGRILAIDYGHVRLGFAISDAERRWASPFENYTRINPQRDTEFIRRIIRDERIVLLVVGLPVHLDGRESKKSHEARKFANWLHTETQLPVALFDERFTTQEARDHLNQSGLTRKRQRARLDMLAAHALLQAFLESLATGSVTDPPRSLDDNVDAVPPEC